MPPWVAWIPLFNLPQQVDVVIGQIIGQRNFNFRQQVSELVLSATNAQAFEPQPSSAGSLRRHSHSNRPLGRRHIDFRTLGGFHKRDRHGDNQVLAVATKMFVRRDVYRD